MRAGEPLTGERSKELFRLADEDPPGVIQVQRDRRGSAHRRLPDYVVTFPPKMCWPMVAAGVEQGNVLAGAYLDRSTRLS